MAIQLTRKVKAPEVTQSFVNRVYKATNQYVDYPKDFSVSLAVVGPAIMKRLNKQYRSVNQVTDVLSFPYSENTGEIVICYNQAVKQAKEKDNALKNELCWLIIHGLLHLLGYDHEKSEHQARKMRNLETKILSNV